MTKQKTKSNSTKDILLQPLLISVVILVIMAIVFFIAYFWEVGFFFRLITTLFDWKFIVILLLWFIWMEQRKKRK